MTQTEQDYADFQAWKANKAAAQAAEEAARMSFPDVLHRLINSAPWNHTAERDQAHAAVDREYTPDKVVELPPPPPQGGNADQGIAAGTNG